MVIPKISHCCNFASPLSLFQNAVINKFLSYLRFLSELPTRHIHEQLQFLLASVFSAIACQQSPISYPLPVNIYLNVSHNCRTIRMTRKNRAKPQNPIARHAVICIMLMRVSTEMGIGNNSSSRYATAQTPPITNMFLFRKLSSIQPTAFSFVRRSTPRAYCGKCLI